MTGSISVSGLLGGTAGQIDTTALISGLMQAAAVPQTQLQDQLATTNTELSAYQSINTGLTALQTAAEALTAASAWTATAATSSSSSVVASSDGTASAGATTFSVTQLAQAQVSTIPIGSDGTVMPQPPSPLVFVRGDGTQSTVTPASSSATDVAAAINQANIGIRAAVVATDSGSVLQLSGTQTGSTNSFSTSGLSGMQNLTTAQNAQVTVGDPAAGGYTVSSSTNTFSSFIPGVTFTASALASNVTISVASDSQSISDKVQALVTAANSANNTMATYTAQGGTLEGRYEVTSLQSAITSAVSNGTGSGGSLKSYGIDVDKNGIISFDAGAFASAYAADPTGTQQAIAGAFATSLDTTSSNAVAASTGTISQAITSEKTHASTLRTGIANWTTRLAGMQTSLQTKYAAMETALAKLQSQQSYLTSMFNSINGTSSTSSSGSSTG